MEEKSIKQLSYLLPDFAKNKKEMEEAKKICDEQNKTIKQIMSSENLDSIELEGYKAVYSIQHRESVNEYKMLNILQNNEADIPAGIIKVKPYIDSDALENAIYNGQISSEILLKLDTCREVKEVEVLKVTKIKGGK